MRKRERENPCRVCGHYHKYEEGEICDVCGHRMPALIEKPVHQESAFPSEILKDFLYLGSYDNASRSEVLKTLGISHILNMVPACQNLYHNSFTYHCLKDDKSLQFDDAIQFIEQCAKDRAHVLVHCMTGKSRSPAIVIAYLMKCKGWRLTQSFQWVKERRTQVDLSSGAQQQLLEFEQRLFGSNEAMQAQNLVQSDPRPTLAFGISKLIDTSSLPIFSQLGSMSIIDGTRPNSMPDNFVFRAVRNEDDLQNTEDSSLTRPMDSSS